MFRKKGIIGLILFFILIFMLMYFFTDKWLERKIESIATATNGALVEIDNLQFSPFGLHLSWDRFQITDRENTMKNALETGKCDFDLAFAPLLSGKVIIEDFKITGVKRNTDRETDGKIELPPKKESKEPGFIESTIASLEKEVSDAPILNLNDYKNKMNADSILAMLEVKSPGKIDSLKSLLQEKYDSWDKRLALIKIDEDYRNIENEIKSIKVNELKRVDRIAGAVMKVNDVKKKVDSLKNLLKNTQKDLSTDLKETSSAKNLVAKWIKDDYSNALSKAKLPDLSTENIGKILFGKRIINKLKQYLGYVATARSYYLKISSGEEKKAESPPRFEGQNIYFYEEHADPDFWIKNIELSGQADENLSVGGKIQNIVSDQRLIGKPMEIDLNGKSKTGESLTLNGILDYVTDIPGENINLNYSGFSLEGAKLSDSQLLPNEIKKGKGNISANIKLSGDEINGNINFTASDVIFDFIKTDKNKNDLQKIIQKLITKIDKVEFNASISGQKDNLKFNLNSNLDRMFADNLKSVLGEEVGKLKKKINDKIEREVSPYKSRINSFISEKQNSLNSQLSKYGVKLDSLNGLLDGKYKELDKRKKELEGSLKEKILKKIF